MSLRRLFVFGLSGYVVLIAVLGFVGLGVGLKAYRSFHEASEHWAPQALALSQMREHGSLLLQRWEEYQLLASGTFVHPQVADRLIRQMYAELVGIREARDRLAVWYRACLALGPSHEYELQALAAVDSLLRLSRHLEALAAGSSTFRDAWSVRERLGAFHMYFSDVLNRAVAFEQERIRSETSAARASVRRALWAFVGFGLVSLVAAVLIGLALAKKTAAPVIRLAQASEKVSQGRLDVRVEATGPAEIKTLAESFNRMVERLQEVTAELEAANEALREELTERRRAEIRLEEERNLLRAVIDHVPDGIYFKDSAGIYQFVNQPLLEAAGLEEKDVIGRDDSGIPENALLQFLSRVDNRARRLRRAELRKEAQVKEGDGKRAVYVASVVPVFDPERRLLGTVGIAQDVTSQREAEKQIHESEQRYRAIFEAAPIGLMLIDTSGRVLAVNDALLKIMGSPSKEMTLGLNLLSHPQIRRHGVAQLVRECIQKRRPLAKEMSYRSVWGKEVEIALCLTPILDEMGQVRYVQAMVEDQTERKRLQRELMQSQKLEAVGRLAGGIAHDFNNIMTGILGYTQFLLSVLAEDDQCRSDLLEIEKLARRAASLTQQLLAFSRQQILRPRPINLNNLVKETEKLLRRLIGEHIELRTVLKEDLPPVEADPTQIQQVIMNLAVNARDAMPTGGTLTIETRTVEIDSGFEGENLRLQPGTYVMLAVSDTGIGMDEETKARAFEPFFTTKGVGEGTGLGLATVKGIVEQSGGRVWLYSEPGKGTTVKILLPAASEARAAETREPEAARGEEEIGGTETILFVEDEGAIRDMVERALRDMGYTVLTAADAEEALRISEAYEGEIDLLLTDVVMPGMNGPELAKLIRRRRPQISVLYTSGYADDVIARAGMLDSREHFVAKPYRPAELARHIRMLLDRRPVEKDEQLVGGSHSEDPAA